MNTQYRKNLKDVATACKNYTDKRFDDFKWELGTHTIDTATDSDVAYQKQAPNGTIGCQINSVGGMSYKSENLIVLSDVALTDTGKGVTYQVENGVITLNGTATSDFNISLSISLSLIAGTYTHCQCVNFPSGLSSSLGISGSAVDGDNDALKYSRTFSPQSSVTSSTMYYVIKNGTTFSNLKLYPMLVTGSTAPTTFKQGFEGIRDSAVISLVVSGENLANPNNTFTYSGYSDLGYFECVGGKTYTLKSFGTYTGNHTIFAYDGTNWSIVTSHNLSNGYTLTAPYGTTRIGFNESQHNVMAIYGSTIPTTFVNYIAPITKTILASIQALAGYGWGINDTCYNYIDFNTKKFVQKVGRIVLNDLNVNSWVKTGSNNIVNNGLTPLGKASSLNVINTSTATMAIGGNTNQLVLLSTSYLNGTLIADWDLSDFKTYIANNTIYVYYELATPVETDISSYITDNDKFLEVEPLGTITFTNTYEQEVPSEITYLTEVAK